MNQAGSSPNTSSSSSSNNGTELSISIQILLVTIPIILSPIIGIFSWVIRGYFDNKAKLLEQHRDDKKKYMIRHINRQIRFFYWPLSLELIRYRHLVNRYKDFKSGHFSLSSDNPSGKDLISNTENFEKSQDSAKNKQNINIEMKKDQINNNIIIDIYDENADNKMVEKNINIITSKEKNLSTNNNNSSSGKNIITIKEKNLSTNNNNSSSGKNIVDEQIVPSLTKNRKKNKGIGLKNAIKIINKFNQAIDEYHNKIMLTLQSIQKIYTKYAPLAEPDIYLLQGLSKLDEYITYMTTFTDLSEKNSADKIMEEKMAKAKFPEDVTDMIEDQLHYLQSIYNDIVYNHNTVILDINSNPVQNSNINNRKDRLSAFRQSHKINPLSIIEVSEGNQRSHSECNQQSHSECSRRSHSEN